MRVSISQLIKSCGIRPDSYRDVPAAETKSIGLQADARVVMVFASPSGQLYNDVTDPAHLSGPRHLDSVIVTPNPRPLTGPDSYRDLQKHMPTRTRTAPN